MEMITEKEAIKTRHWTGINKTQAKIHIGI